jgi:peptidoglycan/xylan/chitin deacetylase (PgdA/CDA1 family)
MIRLLMVVLAIALGAYYSYEAVEAPENQLFGKTLYTGAPSQREVALTFDDGPNPPYTDRILDVLHQEHVHATFFVVGRAAVAYPDTLRRIARDGNAIGNHTWDHEHMIVDTPAGIRSELTRTEAAIERITGKKTDLMRPPFGVRDFAVIDQAHKLGYHVVMWSVPLPRDWEQPGSATIAKRVMENVTGGSIIVLHDGNRGLICGRDRGTTAADCNRQQDIAATREIIEGVRAKGFRFVTIPELMGSTVAANR